MNTQYQQERQVKVVIDKYHSEPIKARQLHLARGDQPGRITTLMMHIQASISAKAKVVAAGAKFRHEPVVKPDPVAEAVDTVVNS